MQLRTMAMEVTSKNWSVAVAILGPDFAAIPQPEIVGAYVVINTFDTYRAPRRLGHSVRYGRVNNELTLTNVWVSAEDFAAMYDYDKRIKNTESFFEVDQVAPQPITKLHDPVEDKLRELVEVYTEDS